jgi:flagellar motor switch protein FliM
MEKILRQEEIDALFEAARTSTEETGKGEVRMRILPYSYASAGQISTEQLRAISMLNDLFARNLTHNLTASLRTKFQVSLVSAEQIPFNDFLLRIPEINYMASVRLEPLGALAAVQVDMLLAPPIIDLALGGDGRGAAARELTDIEESILGSIVDIVCRELTAAWQPVGLTFSFERRQVQTQVARIMAVNEKTLCLSFEIRMPQCSGLLNLAFPAVVSNTILRRLTSDWGHPRRHSPEARARMESLVRHIRVGTALQMPAVRIAESELERLEPGMVLRLPLTTSVAAHWTANGKALAAAHPVRQGGTRAARIQARLERPS